jgi:hypothetical protein
MKTDLLAPQASQPLQHADDVADVSMFERLVKDPSVDVDKLERLIALHERALERKAKDDFNAAMSAAQTDMRPVATDAGNTLTGSRYASYTALDRALRPIYTTHGFGLSFDTGDTTIDGIVRVLCYVTHRAGYARTYHVDMPNDGKGAKGGDVMTKTHATGAAMSYGMRYLLKMIFNVAVGEDDTDGNTPIQRQAPAAPKGFDNWLLDLRAVAESDGSAALKSAWDKSSLTFRKHLTATDAKAWESIKRVALTTDGAK